MLALVVGCALAILGLAFVLMPLVRGGDARARTPLVPEPPRDASALEALREIEFDQATGKLSPEDYASLRATYAPRALAEIKARDAAGVPPSASAGAPVPGIAAESAGHAPDAAELLIARMRARGTTCPEHGARPESDALYCSDCGRFLAESCLRCGAAVEDPHSRFCGECGAPLAA